MAPSTPKICYCNKTCCEGYCNNTYIITDTTEDMPTYKRTYKIRKGFRELKSGKHSKASWQSK